MAKFKLRETDDGIELIFILERFANPSFVAVRIKDVIDILDDSNYIKKEEKFEFLQRLLDHSIDIGII